ncbi:3'-5' exonuclease domain-containing protein 2 [Chitinibacter sp. SCUT-21]|uniref:3'-5' exonuclease n=1 Tax=Chitinibacter sp. SCUT-21 TaxID=2970891 RepID=UPI0035A636D1
MPERRYPPNKEEIALFPPFAGLSLAKISVPSSSAEFDAALADLSHQRFIGFDTESRPVFRIGELSRGPHLLQLTTDNHAYLLQAFRPETKALLEAILASREIVKVGFGLESDRADIARNFGIQIDAVLDLNAIFRRQGFTQTLGVKGAVAVVLQQKITKSKKVTMSNWAQARLQDNQLLYAANDAYAALKVLHALNLPAEQLPIHYLSRAIKSAPKTATP